MAAATSVASVSAAAAAERRRFMEGWLALLALGLRTGVMRQSTLATVHFNDHMRVQISAVSGRCCVC